MDLLPSDGESANPTAWSWRTIPDALDSTRPIYDVKYENGTDSQDSDVVMSAKKVVEHEEESPPEVANTDETIDYMNFLQELQIWSVDNCCPGKILVKSSDKPLSSGVKMDAYSALLKYEDQNGKKMEAHQPNTYLKCYKIKTTQKSEENNRSHTVRELNTQLKDTIEDIRAMRNNANGHSTPRILIYWEEVDSAAEFPIYRPILCVGEDVVMGNLEDYVRDCKLNKSSDFCPNDLIKEIHSAFDFLHTGGLVHGNLKPSSILVRKARSIRGDTDLPMLIDIGFGYESWKSDVVEKTPPLEITPYWCAPEIFEDDASPVSYTRDYYSFALIVWFILFGYPVGDLKKGISEADCDMFRKIKRDSRIPNPDESGTPITGLSVNYELGNLLESTEDLTDRVPDLQDMLFEAFNARWKWELAEQTEMKRLEDEESIERRGEIMKDLMDQGKIRELEWDPELSKWIPVKDIMHHNYRAIMESGLQRDPKARVCLIQKETPTVFSEEFSYQLASFYITGSRDASTAVFPTGEKVIEKFENVMQEIQRQIEESKVSYIYHLSPNFLHQQTNLLCNSLKY
ncbi:hypothetical protein EDC01DRAFT_219225 [Geopyxis carbonaria]|nr:hypothetical protein EDC01DRAFT_219225 [Geopyxis carbonaria]